MNSRDHRQEMRWIEVIVSTAFLSTPTTQQESRYSKPSQTAEPRSKRP